MPVAVRGLGSPRVKAEPVRVLDRPRGLSAPARARGGRALGEVTSGSRTQTWQCGPPRCSQSSGGCTCSKRFPDHSALGVERASGWVSRVVTGMLAATGCSCSHAPTCPELSRLQGAARSSRVAVLSPAALSIFCNIMFLACQVHACGLSASLFRVIHSSTEKANFMNLRFRGHWRYRQDDRHCGLSVCLSAFI